MAKKTCKTCVVCGKSAEGIKQVREFFRTSKNTLVSGKVKEYISGKCKVCENAMKREARRAKKSKVAVKKSTTKKVKVVAKKTIKKFVVVESILEKAETIIRLNKTDLNNILDNIKGKNITIGLSLVGKIYRYTPNDDYVVANLTLPRKLVEIAKSNIEAHGADEIGIGIKSK